MGASSVTGKGQGSAGKITGPELEIFANGPSVVFSGSVESAGGPTSPPTDGNTVIFPYPLKGGASKYAVLLTTVNAGKAYVSQLLGDSDNFPGFSFVTESEGTVMYMVCKHGAKANLRQ